MKSAERLDQYLQEARSWDSDRIAHSRRSARIAWWVATGGWACALAASAALALLMPLKRVEPFVIRVDNSTGIVDVVPAYTPHASMDQVVTRYFLTHYITICERFNLVTAESDYQECGAFHTARRNQAWYALWNTANPTSPLNVHKDGSVVRVQVESVSFIKRSNGVADLAQVRYLKSERHGEAATGQVTHWIATIQYAYGSPSKSPAMRAWNPLGFKIVDVESEPEVLTSATAAEPAAESAP
jgi:type IV secretion system protein VirB8